mgnify:CR=1 FL=1
MSYKHLTITEREKILFCIASNFSISEIAKYIGRNKSTVSRELKRNCKFYSPSEAQNNYQKRRKNCRPHKKLENPKLFELVKKLFLQNRWSPEQISARLKLENYPVSISCKTIYRAIYAGMFDTAEQRKSTGNRGAIRKLRHRGKSCHSKNYLELRGKIPISNPLSERPKEANERNRLGDFEADTVAGEKGKACLLTLTDRKSRFLICRKLDKKSSECVKNAMIEALNGQPLFSITPDRGKEFSQHAEVTKALGVEFYFPPPHHPWERGTNENTNGLLREYFPKGQDLTDINDAYLQTKVSDLNHRPRKCLGYKTPAEIYFSISLHFT